MNEVEQGLEQRLIDLRKHLGLTQKELGDEIGFSDTYISELENGNRDYSNNVIRKYVAISKGTPYEMTANDFFQ